MRNTALFPAIAAASVISLCGACGMNDLTNHSSSSSSLQSLRVSNFQPANLGTPARPVQFDTAIFDLTAIGPDGKAMAGDFDADIYISFSGNKVGLIDACGVGQDSSPLASVHLTNGVATGVKVPLLRAF